MAVLVPTTGPATAVVPAIREEVEHLGRGFAVLEGREFEYYQSRWVSASS